MAELARWPNSGLRSSGRISISAGSAAAAVVVRGSRAGPLHLRQRRSATAFRRICESPQTTPSLRIADDANGDQHPARIVLVDTSRPSRPAISSAHRCQVARSQRGVLAIFQRHAPRSREAAFGEIARLAYLAPRLREGGAARTQGRGTPARVRRVAARDRPAQLRDRSPLRRELQAIEKMPPRRRRRSTTDGRNRCYTMPESSLMARVDRSDLCSRPAFCQPHTTVRAMHPEPAAILAIDTGLHQKLPHDLVALSAHPLDEAREAALAAACVSRRSRFPAQTRSPEQVLSGYRPPARRVCWAQQIDKLDTPDSPTCRPPNQQCWCRRSPPRCARARALVGSSNAR